MKVNYMLVVGPRDEQGGTVSVRDRSRGDLGAVPIAGFIEKSLAEIATRGTNPVVI